MQERSTSRDLRRDHKNADASFSKLAIMHLKLGRLIQRDPPPGDPVRSQGNQLSKLNLRSAKHLVTEAGITEKGCGLFLTLESY